MSVWNPEKPNGDKYISIRGRGACYAVAMTTNFLAWAAFMGCDILLIPPFLAGDPPWWKVIMTGLLALPLCLLMVFIVGYWFVYMMHFTGYLEYDMWRMAEKLWPEKPAFLVRVFNITVAAIFLPVLVIFWGVLAGVGA